MNKELHDKLNLIKALTSEHFEEYVIIVSNGTEVWDTYKSKTGAYGMIQMVRGDIEHDWEYFRKRNDKETADG